MQGWIVMFYMLGHCPKSFEIPPHPQNVLNNQSKCLQGHLYWKISLTLFLLTKYNILSYFTQTPGLIFDLHELYLTHILYWWVPCELYLSLFTDISVGETVISCHAGYHINIWRSFLPCTYWGCVSTPSRPGLNQKPLVLGSCELHWQEMV